MGNSAYFSLRQLQLRVRKLRAFHHGVIALFEAARTEGQGCVAASSRLRAEINSGMLTYLDTLDHTLLGLLRIDARMSVADLAKELEVSRATVGNRIKRLEESGIIVGYTVRVRPDAEPQEIKAWMSIAVEGDRTREVVKTLLGEPAVSSLHDTNGRWDLLAEVHAASIAELSEVLERVRKIKGIETTETSIHLQTFCRG